MNPKPGVTILTPLLKILRPRETILHLIESRNDKIHEILKQSETHYYVIPEKVVDSFIGKIAISGDNVFIVKNGFNKLTFKTNIKKHNFTDPGDVTFVPITHIPADVIFELILRGYVHFSIGCGY